MTPPRLLSELEALAARIGVAIRAEPFGSGLLAGRGGLCRIRGEFAVVMDSSLPLADKIAVLAGALARFDLDAIYVPPLLRARIESARAGRSPVPRAPAKVDRSSRPAGVPGLARAGPRR
jgi:hypothetical protein